VQHRSAESEAVNQQIKARFNLRAVALHTNVVSMTIQKLKLFYLASVYLHVVV
jgi:hypothetical protein